MKATLERREFLRVLGALGFAGSGLVQLPGCGYYEAASGDPYAPWDFPGGETVPERLVARAAILAASPHNTQPWGLAIGSGVVDLRARLDRHLGAMDGLRRELHIGLGCALENMVIAARSAGRAPQVAILPDPADEPLVSRVTLGPGPVDPDPLFAALPIRHTNRGTYAAVEAPAGLEGALRALQDEPSLQLHWVGAPADRARVAAETVAATEAIIADAPMSHDGNAWYRHSRAEIEQHRDGPTLDATGNSATIRTLGKLVGRPPQAEVDAYWLEATRSRQTTGSAFVILSSDKGNARIDQLRTGRVYQRMHLWTTLGGLAMQPLNQLPERQDREETEGLSPRFTGVLEGLVGSNRRAQMLFRVGYPWDAALPSPRRPLEWVVS